MLVDRTLSVLPCSIIGQIVPTNDPLGVPTFARGPIARRNPDQRRPPLTLPAPPDVGHPAPPPCPGWPIWSHIPAHCPGVCCRVMLAVCQRCTSRLTERPQSAALMKPLVEMDRYKNGVLRSNNRVSLAVIIPGTCS